MRVIATEPPALASRSSQTRLGALCLTFFALLVPSCSKTETDGERSCPRKPPLASVEGFPESFPIPQGAYTAGEDTSGPKTSYRRAQIVLTGTIDDFFAYARSAWPKVGYRLLPGEHDEHDAEAGFLYPNGTNGALKLNEHSCAQPWTTMTVILQAGQVLPVLPTTPGLSKGDSQ